MFNALPRAMDSLSPRTLWQERGTHSLAMNLATIVADAQAFGREQDTLLSGISSPTTGRRSKCDPRSHSMQRHLAAESLREPGNRGIPVYSPRVIRGS